jgi:putative transposase
MLAQEQIRARIRRWYVPDAVYFITAVTQGRQPLFADGASMELLRVTMRRAKEHHPFTMRAYVFLHDHFHLLIFVPETTNVSKLLQSIQRNFTRNYQKAHHIDEPVRLWQRGFWDHVIRDERDFANHLDYVHYNPVKHGYVSEPEAYAHTSFHEYVRRGWYEVGWGHTEPEAISHLDFE